MVTRQTVYNRRRDLDRLKERAINTPLLVTLHDSGPFAVVWKDEMVCLGRWQVVYAYIDGFQHAWHHHTFVLQRPSSEEVLSSPESDHVR
jgi:hypothetical protein